MTACESRVQAFAVAMREESFSGTITARGRSQLEAVLVELVPRSQTASAQGCQSILVRLDSNVSLLEASGDVKPEAAARLHSLTSVLNPPDASPYPSTSPSGGNAQAALGTSPLLWLAVAGAAAIGIWFWIRKKT